jgi:quercetin dioxygenase-like cupin family protein
MTDQVSADERASSTTDSGNQSVGVARPYSPSPRPMFDVPSLIKRSDVTRHLWGDDVSRCVSDLIYASTNLIHALVFALPAGGRFEHSEEYRTVFGADEVLQVLSGTMVLANPETGEVTKVAAGSRVFFRKGTWHHAFAHGNEPLRVLEIFAPPPSAGTSGAYARTQPYLQTPQYGDDSIFGAFPGFQQEAQTIRSLPDAEIIWRRDLGVLCGFLISTEHLTVHTLEVNPGEVGRIHAHGGDELLYVTEGTLWVRAWQDGKAFVFELNTDDACLVPAGCEHEYRNYSATTACATVGVAPSYTTE